MNELRPYQLAALQASKTRYEAGVRRQLIALPTGTGKTVVFANVKKFHNLQGRVLVVVHREELVDQAERAFRKWCKGTRIGIEKGPSTSCSLDEIVIASVQSLGRADSGRLQKFNPDDFGLLICDEAHHSVANTYLNVFEHFGVLDGRNRALLLGVTATPVRSDGKGLCEVFDEIVYHMSLRKAVTDGWLVDLKGIRARTATNLDQVHVRKNGDFDEVELGRAVNTEIRNSLVLKTWAQRASERRTLVFCVDIQHAKDLAATFRSAGVKADAIWGADPERREKLRMHQNGTLRVLTNCAVLTEGYDDWAVSCIVMARPTQSELLFVQMAGRGTRIPNTISNVFQVRAGGTLPSKEDCIIIDVVDNTAKHSLVTLPTLFGFPKGHDFKGQSATAVARTDHSLTTGHAARADILRRVNPSISEIDLLGIQKSDRALAQYGLTWTKGTDCEQILRLPNRQCFKIRSAGSGWVVHAEVRPQPFTSESFCSLADAFRYVQHSLAAIYGHKAPTPGAVGSQLESHSAPLCRNDVAVASEGRRDKILQAQIRTKCTVDWLNRILEHWTVEKRRGKSRFRCKSDRGGALVQKNPFGRWALIPSDGADFTTKWFKTAVEAFLRAEEYIGTAHIRANTSKPLASGSSSASSVGLHLLRTFMPQANLSRQDANSLLAAHIARIRPGTKLQ